MYEQNSMKDCKETAISEAVSYDLVELFKYLDELHDLSCLSFTEESKVYSPHGRAWIKSQLYNYMRSKAE